MLYYEENKVKELLKCPQCNKTFDDPHILPCCSESLCAKCLPSSGAKCALCLQPIDEKINNNYQPNKALNRLIGMQPVNVLRNSELASSSTPSSLLGDLKMRTDSMQADIDQLRLDMTETVARKKIAEHCLHLRNEVLARTVKAVESIRRTSEDIEQQINNYEKSCLESFETGKEALVDDLKQLESEYSDFRGQLEESLGQPAIVSANNLSAISNVVNELKLKIVHVRQCLLKLMFNRRMLDYHECPNAALGCTLVEKKLNPSYRELTPLRIKEDLLDSSDLLFTYFQVGFLKNGHLVLSISDGEIFKSIYVLDLTMCESTIGYIVKKIDLFTKKSPLFNIIVLDDYIVNSEYDFKTNAYQLAYRDTNLSVVAKMAYVATETIDVTVDATSMLLYMLRYSKIIDVYRLVANKGTIESVRTINIATMCRQDVCAPCCACFWTTPVSPDMEFKVREGRLFFKSANRIWMFDAKGTPNDGPFGSFSLRKQRLKQQQQPTNKEALGRPVQSDRFSLNETERTAVRTNWFINSKNEIIVHLMHEEKLIFFDVSGEILFERDLNDFPNAQKLSFCLDHLDNLFFYDNENIYT